MSSPGSGGPAPILIELEGGDAVELPHDDARLLVEALWSVSATPGTVVTVGKIEHRLSSTDGRRVELSELEGSAIRAALAASARWTPALERLRSVIR